MKEKILIIGAGGHARSCVDVIELENKFEIIGYVEKDSDKKSFKYPILGCDDDLKNLFKITKFAFIGVGQIKNVNDRVRIYENLKSIGFILPTIISPLAYVSPYANIQEASIIMHYALVNTNAQIGKACIINSKALVEHDAIIKDFCHISTTAVVNGKCIIEEKSFLGSNTHLKHGTILKAKSVYYNKLNNTSLFTGGE